MDRHPFDEAAERVSAGADHHAEAARLVALMTVSEKLGCLDGDLPFWPGLIDMGSGGYTSHPWPAARVERLGIPGIRFADGPRGCVVGPSTAFPVAMARGATFDPELERSVGDAIGAELRSAGATYTGAVCINLLRHPAWGRAQETYGEDPHHVASMGVAFTQGLQAHVMACMKHFALNSMENARFTVDVTADERALHEVYLPHFRRVAAAGVASVMSAYNSLNGEWCGQNRTLLVDILRDEWGWDGFVTSDFIFGLRDPALSVEAGLNIEMPFRQQRATTLGDAVSSGELSMVDVDARVVETIATFLRFAHVFEDANSDAPEPDDTRACPEHRALARRAASASMVLLRNDDLLPVDGGTLARVAVLGRLAAVPNLGDAGSSNVLPPEVITPLDGLRAALPHTEVLHSDDDASIASGADLTLVVVGYTRDDEGEYLGSDTGELMALFPPMDHPELGLEASADEPAAPPSEQEQPAQGQDPPQQTLTTAEGGDRSSLRLHDAEERLIREAAAVSDRVVVAVMSGSAVVMPWLDDVGATLMIWYPGMEGGHALADVLLGRVEPGGRLPFAVPRDEADLVPFDKHATAVEYGLLHGQWLLDADEVVPHRPFGFGLGYTTWNIDAVAAESRAAALVTASLTNTGTRAGATVVQVYASVPGSVHVRPPARLVGFARVEAGPGRSIDASIELDLDLLRIRGGGAWTTEDADVTLTVGLSAGDPSAHRLVAD